MIILKDFSIDNVFTTNSLYTKVAKEKEVQFNYITPNITTNLFFYPERVF